jgi:pimeloyl-ACP methyl ester carboxylesterase
MQFRRPIEAAAVLVGALGLLNGAAAQDISALQTPKSPLVLKAMGSFFVGGEVVNQTGIESGLGLAGHSVINQMYVQYMKPRDDSEVPVVMVHGGTLSGKSYETTPDGRMGWNEYFVRKGHAVYNVDAVAVGRSGFNQAVYNNVRAGVVPPATQPNMSRVHTEYAWVGFRFGPTLGVPFADAQFPVNAADEFLKQDVPNPALLPTPNPNFNALSDLALKLKGAVVMGHSQGGRHPLDAALVNPKGVKGAIVIEPSGAGCNSAVYTDQQITTLATIPILVVYGDHLDQQPPLPISTPLVRFNDCQAFIARVKNAGGNAQMLWPPALGIKGNSHMLMFDKNNLKIADLILKWIDKNVKYKKGHDDDDDDHGHHH